MHLISVDVDDQIRERRLENNGTSFEQSHSFTLPLDSLSMSPPQKVVWLVTIVTMNPDLKTKPWPMSGTSASRRI